MKLEFYKGQREIHGESNVWTTAQTQKKIYEFYVDVGFVLNSRSVGDGKLCLLVWSFVEERGWSYLGKVIRS